MHFNAPALWDCVPYLLPGSSPASYLPACWCPCLPVASPFFWPPVASLSLMEWAPLSEEATDQQRRHLAQQLEAARTTITHQRGTIEAQQEAILRLNRAITLLASIPLPSPKVGGRCGVTPRDDDAPRKGEIKGRSTRSTVAPTDSLHSLGGGSRLFELEEREEMEGSEESPSRDSRMAALEAQLEQQQATIADQQATIAQQQDAINRLMAMASRMMGEGTVEPSDRATASRMMGEGPVEPSDHSEREAPTDRKESLPRPTDAVEGASRELAALQLRTAQKKESTTMLRQVFGWCKEVLVTLDRATAIQAAVPRRYGLATYASGGSPRALDDVLAIFQGFSLPPPLHEPVKPRVQLNPMIAVGATFHRWGGSGRLADVYTCRVADFKPLKEGEDKRLAAPSIMMLTSAPPDKQRALPANMAEFLQAALAMAYVMGLFLGPRVEHELHITVRTLYERGMRAPSLMPVEVACHLLDQMVSMVLEAIYALASGRTPVDVGTDKLTEEEVMAYREQGWLHEDEDEPGPTFIVRPTSTYFTVWYVEPCQAASLSTGRFASALEFMGIEKASRKPPQGGPTGASEAATPQVVQYRPTGVAYIPRNVYADAERAMGRKPGDAPVCFRFLSREGCQRVRCNLQHLQIAPAQLRQQCQASPVLLAVFTHHGGVRSPDVPASQAPGKAGATTANPSVPSPSWGGGSSSESSDEDFLVQGGRSTGGVEVQVPYLSYIPGCYPKAPLHDERATPLTQQVQRPATTHPEPPPREFTAQALLHRQPPRMARVAGHPFLVTSPDDSGAFQVTVGPFSFVGQDLGQVFEWRGRPVVNACVTLTWAAALGMTPQALFGHLLSAAYDADASLGTPSTAASPTVVLVRAIIHDVAASQAVGHA